jgi:hypothetical protein
MADQVERRPLAVVKCKVLDSNQRLSSVFCRVTSKLITLLFTHSISIRQLKTFQTNLT